MIRYPSPQRSYDWSFPTRSVTVFNLLAVAAAALLLAGCSLDYGAARVAQKLDENIPDLVLYDFQHTSVRHDRKAFQISAASSSSFGQKKQQVLKKVSFLEFDNKGDVITRGTADEAVIDSDTNNVELTGNISFYSKREEATVTCSSLSWNDKDRTLKSKPDDLVTIRKDSGTYLSGRGFSADTARNEIDFSGAVAGTVVADDTKSGQK